MAQIKKPQGYLSLLVVRTAQSSKKPYNPNTAIIARVRGAVKRRVPCWSSGRHAERPPWSVDCHCIGSSDLNQRLEVWGWRRLGLAAGGIATLGPFELRSLPAR